MSYALTGAGKPPSAPELLQVDRLVIVATFFILLATWTFNGVFISGPMIIGGATVLGMAIVVARFPVLIKFISFCGRWLDLAFLLFSFWLAAKDGGGGTSFLAATFGGVFFSAYISVVRFTEAKRRYKEHYKQAPPRGFFAQLITGH